MRRISLASSFDLLLLKLSGYEVFLPDHPTSFKSIFCQFCSSFYTFSSSLWPFYCFCCCCCCCFISYFFLFTANFSVFLLISALEQRGGFFWVEGRGKRGEIRLITSHTERTKFFIARKKAASFRDTLVLQKTLGSWDLSFQNFFTKGRFQVIPQ